MVALALAMVAWAMAMVAWAVAMALAMVAMVMAAAAHCAVEDTGLTASTEEFLVYWLHHFILLAFSPSFLHVKNFYVPSKILTLYQTF